MMLVCCKFRRIPKKCFMVLLSISLFGFSLSVIWECLNYQSQMKWSSHHEMSLSKSGTEYALLKDPDSTKLATVTTAPMVSATKSFISRTRGLYSYLTHENALNGTSYVGCRMLGGIGNKMFMYASAYGIALHTNKKLVMEEDDALIKYFHPSCIFVDHKVYESLRKHSRSKYAKIDCGFDPYMFDLPQGKSVHVGIYIQSYKYFEHVEDAIRKEFTFRKNILDSARNIIDECIDEYLKRKNGSSVLPVLVGVHIRRGDFFNNSYGYDVATPQYMKNATSYFRNRYGNVLFLVCSNGMDWAKEHVQGDDVIYIEGHDYITDMAVLVSCNHTISSVGSFSWWVGFLTGGEVVYYQWPARNGTRLRKQFSSDYSDYFPPSWIGMN